MDVQLLTVRGLRYLLRTKEQPYLLSNGWMVYLPTRCLACICSEVMELLMEANPWDKGFFSTLLRQLGVWHFV